ncbi:MAG: putative oxidoreductase, aryl-alcohol dehydrogenase like protein [Glaciihabitans sp.]|nr:putative oxidoreductase, aryl-alcohol dehydrogenase like protein [Glaciihabitans sp.]
MELTRHLLGTTGLSVTSVCIGTSPLGSSPRLYGYEVAADQAIATVRAALQGPFNFIDTSNAYGDGESERRIGEALREVGGLPQDFVLATKVDPDPETGDFSGDRVRASLEESLERLGVARLQLLYLHDPERISFAEATSARGAVPALVALKEQGLVDHIGVAGGSLDVLMDYVETGVFEVVLTHNRYTLIDQTAEPLLREAKRRGMGVVNAAPYGGGMLAKGARAQPLYAYRRDEDATRQKALTMQALCESFGVPLAAAALQFSVRDSLVASTAVGVSNSDRIEETRRLLEHDVPDALWQQLDALARS